MLCVLKYYNRNRALSPPHRRTTLHNTNSSKNSTLLLKFLQFGQFFTLKFKPRFWRRGTENF